MVGFYITKVILVSAIARMTKLRSILSGKKNTHYREKRKVNMVILIPKILHKTVGKPEWTYQVIPSPWPSKV
jgi:hypothetical protein